MAMRARIGLVAAGLLLSACEGGLPSLSDGLSGAIAGLGGGSKDTGQTAVTVTRQEVTLTGPRGFCVDPVSTRNSGAQAFVVFGNCAAITGNPDQPQPWLQAVVTATVSAAETGVSIAPQAETLLEFFRSPGGRATLSRSEDAQTVTIVDSFVEEGSVYLHVRDTSPPAFRGAQSSYWRGYTDAGGAVVALSVIGFEDTPVSRGDGVSVLRGFVDKNARARLPIGG